MITVLGAHTFRQIWPGISGNYDDAYFRQDWAPPHIRLSSSHPHPRWQGSDPTLASVPVVTDPHDRRSASINRPASPTCIQVTDGQSVVQIWFLSATITVRTQGIVTTSAPSWAATQGYLQSTYGAHGYSFTQLGLVQFDSAATSIADVFFGRRYGGAVEIVGRVTPSIIQHSGMRFYLARRITRATVLGQDGQGRPLPTNRDPHTTVPIGVSNDTSLQQSGALTATGELFDWDFPGSVMRGANLIGDRHTWNVSFEQCVVVGRPPASRAVDPWPNITRDGLAVSPVATWRANYSAVVRRAVSATQGIELTLTGSVG